MSSRDVQEREPREIRRELREAVERSGAIAPGERVLALLSGGADSVCLVHVLHELLGPRVAALHVNHGLRAAAGEDERFCEELCARLRVKLFVERVQVPAGGNLEAAAREARYAAAERVRASAGYDAIATGHTAGDQVETILYRLVTSPGRRALLGMRPRSGLLARPLLEVEADRTRLYCEAAGLAWREDESNEDRALARNRLRHEVLPELRLLHPAAERNVRATAAELRDEAELLEQAVDAAMREAGAGGSPPAVELARIAGLPAALRRLILRRLAEDAAGGPLALGRPELAAIERLGAAGSGEVSLGQGVRALCEYGIVRFLRAPDREPPSPVELPVPGSCGFGDWQVECVLEAAGGRALESPLGSADAPRLDAALLAPTLVVRAWREGDRMRPLGLDGTKSLQDLFVDRKVPRSLRHVLPVVESRGEIAWVAGVAVSERFRLTERTEQVARLDAFERRARGSG